MNENVVYLDESNIPGTYSVRIWIKNTPYKGMIYQFLSLMSMWGNFDKENNGFISYEIPSNIWGATINIIKNRFNYDVSTDINKVWG